MTYIDKALTHCQCDPPTLEPVPELEAVTRCAKCGGWVMLYIRSQKGLAEALTWRPPPPEDDE